ncbi:MAG TPA: hypothetical protein VEJ87_03365, partial [Acidimicrobiales bacterium]|nr:hypothetical protein [Acidimicrobiales bacterium]
MKTLPYLLRNTRHRALRMAVGLTCLGVVAISASNVGAQPLQNAAKHGPSSLNITWMPGYDVPCPPSPCTPAKYDKVGVIKIGSTTAKNVLILEPGTSAAAAYFVPLAQWIVANEPAWQVWSVQRRENLLENQSELNKYKANKVDSTQLFDYYLGYLTNSSITHHYKPINDSKVEFAKNWGMNVAVQDLHNVVLSAEALGGQVVLGGHSLGGSVVTAYATWDFNGTPGADGLSGLVYIDGGSGAPVTASEATTELTDLDASTASPWLSFGGIAAPYAGLFVATGSASALLDPNSASLGQSSGLLPSDLVPPVPVTNVAQFGYALNVGTSPASLAAAQAHLGAGIDTTGSAPYGWDSTGALTPISRFASMFAGAGIKDANGSEWYFPQRLTDDTGAVGDGIANPAQSVLDVNATMGDSLPTSL